MVEFDDLTEAELAMRAILSDRRKLERFAKEARARWALTPAGRQALAECELKSGKVRRRAQTGG